MKDLGRALGHLKKIISNLLKNLANCSFIQFCILRKHKYEIMFQQITGLKLKLLRYRTGSRPLCYVKKFRLYTKFRFRYRNLDFILCGTIM